MLVFPVAWPLGHAKADDSQPTISLTNDLFSVNAGDTVTFTANIDFSPALDSGQIINYVCKISISESPDPSPASWQEITDVQPTSVNAYSSPPCTATYTVGFGQISGHYQAKAELIADDGNAIGPALSWIDVTNAAMDAELPAGADTTNLNDNTNTNTTQNFTPAFSQDALSASITGIPNSQDYDLNSLPMMTIQGNLYGDGSQSYIPVIYISTGGDGVYKAYEPDPPSNGTINTSDKSYDIHQLGSTATNTYGTPFSYDKQFSNASKAGWHDIIVRAYHTDLTDTKPLEAHIPIFLTNETARASAYNMGVLANGKIPFQFCKDTDIAKGAINIQTTFTQPADGEKYHTSVFMFSEDFDHPTGNGTWVNLQPGQVYGSVTTSTTRTQSATKNFDPSAPTGNRQVQAKLFTVNDDGSVKEMKAIAILNVYVWNSCPTAAQIAAAAVDTSTGATPGSGAIKPASFAKFKSVAITDFTSLITALVGDGGSIKSLFYYFIGAGALAGIFYSGFLFIASGGEEKNIEKAKKSLLYVAIGMVAGTLAYGIISIVVDILKSISS